MRGSAPSHQMPEKRRNAKGSSAPTQTIPPIFGRAAHSPQLTRAQSSSLQTPKGLRSEGQVEQGFPSAQEISLRCSLTTNPQDGAADEKSGASNRAEISSTETSTVSMNENTMGEGTEQIALTELKDILSSLATKQDIRGQTEHIEATLKKEIEDIRTSLTQFAGRMDKLELSTTDMQFRVEALEGWQQEMKHNFTSAQFYLDDLENRSRRNNIKIRGIPEKVMGEELRKKVVAILNSYLNKQLTAEIEVDRVHRIPGGTAKGLRPRDTICRIHFYSIKEQIMQKAWDKGPIDFEGSSISLFPDLSRRTLFMRNTMRPLLRYLKDKDFPYRWGYPFALLVRKGVKSFRLQFPYQLRDFFQTLELEPIEIPDWTGEMN